MEEQLPGKGSIAIVHSSNEEGRRIEGATVLKWKATIFKALNEVEGSADKTEALRVHAGNILYDVLYYGNFALVGSNRRVGSIRFLGAGDKDVVVPVNEELLRSLFLAEPDIQSESDDRELALYREELLDPSKEAVEIVL